VGGPQLHPRLSHRLLLQFGRNGLRPRQQSHLPLKPGANGPRPPAPASQHGPTPASLPQVAPAKRRGALGATTPASRRPEVPVKRHGARGATLVSPPAALLAKKLGDLLLLLRLGESGVLLFRLLAYHMYHQQASLGNLHPLHRLGESGVTDGKRSTIKRYVPYPIGFRVHRTYADMY
jgi:hypothetical protein